MTLNDIIESLDEECLEYELMLDVASDDDGIMCIEDIIVDTVNETITLK